MIPLHFLFKEVYELGALKTAKKIWREGGLKELYRGVGISLIRDSLSVGIFFAAYETARFELEVPGSWNAISIVIAGTVAGSAYNFIGGPIDIIKKEMIRRKEPFHRVFLDKWKAGDLKFIRKGVRSSFGRIVPASVVGFLVFEFIRSRKNLVGIYVDK